VLDPVDAPVKKPARAHHGEAGIILPISILLLAVILMLTLVVVTSALRNNTASNKQLYSDKALATAEAGLQTAYHRFVAGAWGVGSGEAEVGPYKYQYSIEELTALTKTHCTGLAPKSEYLDHCITVSATVGGVSRRVQERVLGVAGIGKTFVQSLGSVSINNDNGVLIEGNIEANGEVSINGAKLTGTIIATGLGSSKCEGCTFEKRTAGLTYPNVETGPTEYRSAAYTEAIANNKAETAAFKARYGSAYKTTERVFNTGSKLGSAGAPLLLEGGVYNFCEVNFQQEVWLEIPAGEKVSWYIDNKTRKGSGCNKTGNFIATHGFCVINRAKNPSAFKVMMWGENANPESPPTELKNVGKSTTEFKFTNGACGSEGPLLADIYDPYGTFETTNGGTFGGAIIAESVHATNGMAFVANATIAEGETNGPTAWANCSSTAPNASAASGCY